MLVFPRYSHHSKTGRLVHHHETSYALLLFLMLAVGVLLLGITWSAQASGTDCGVPGKDSCTGSYTVTAVVPGPRPTKPAVITSPTSGQTFETNPITVTGTCPNKSLVKIFTNGVLVGSILCGTGERFSFPVDLVIGKNDLTALAYNTLDQAGPTSPTVTVTLNQPPGGLGYSSELILQSENFYRGTMPGQEVVWPITIIGGLSPYAVNVDWGDGTSDLFTRTAPGPFTASHTYKRVGTGYLGSYPLIIRATDAAGHTAYMQMTTIVNDATGATSTSARTNETVKYWLAWPIWIVLVLMIATFWLGERREKHIMLRKMEEVAV